MLLPWLTLFDFRSALTNFIKPNKINYSEKSDDFAILVPIFNDTKYLTNIDFLKRYPGKVVICTTDVETDKFYADLDKIVKKYNFSVMKCPFSKETVKNPWKIYQKTLLAHDYVLGEALETLKAKYVIFVDADTTCKTDLACLAGLMENKDLDLASLKVIPSKKKTIMENLQFIEYNIAMKSRKIYPWLTSGAAMIAKRKMIQGIMKKHSLFFNGGDIEIGKLAHMHNYKIDYIPVTFYTDVPDTLPKLVKQRYSWFCGAFRHCIINAHTNLFNPIYSLYFTVIIFIMLPLKVHELIFNWYLLPPLVIFYLVMTVVTNWELRSKYMLLFPFYSLFQVIVFPFLGVYRYVKTVIKTKNVGFIRKKYKDGYHPLRYAFNIFAILVIGFTIFNIHFVERSLYLVNIDLLALIGVSFKDPSAISMFFNSSKMFVVVTIAFLGVWGFLKTFFHIKEFHLPKIKIHYSKFSNEVNKFSNEVSKSVSYLFSVR